MKLVNSFTLLNVVIRLFLMFPNALDLGRTELTFMFLNSLVSQISDLK